MHSNKNNGDTGIKLAKVKRTYCMSTFCKVSKHNSTIAQRANHLKNYNKNARLVQDSLRRSWGSTFSDQKNTAVCAELLILKNTMGRLFKFQNRGYKMLNLRIQEDILFTNKQINYVVQNFEEENVQRQMDNLWKIYQFSVLRPTLAGHVSQILTAHYFRFYLVARNDYIEHMLKQHSEKSVMEKGFSKSILRAKPVQPFISENYNVGAVESRVLLKIDETLINEVIPDKKRSSQICLMQACRLENLRFSCILKQNANTDHEATVSAIMRNLNADHNSRKLATETDIKSKRVGFLDRIRTNINEEQLAPINTPLNKIKRSNSSTITTISRVRTLPAQPISTIRTSEMLEEHYPRSIAYRTMEMVMDHRRMHSAKRVRPPRATNNQKTASHVMQEYTARKKLRTVSLNKAVQLHQGAVKAINTNMYSSRTPSVLIERNSFRPVCSNTNPSRSRSSVNSSNKISNSKENVIRLKPKGQIALVKPAHLHKEGINVHRQKFDAKTTRLRVDLTRVKVAATKIKFGGVRRLN